MYVEDGNGYEVEKDVERVEDVAVRNPPPTFLDPYSLSASTSATITFNKNKKDVCNFTYVSRPAELAGIPDKKAGRRI